MKPGSFATAMVAAIAVPALGLGLGLGTGGLIPTALASFRTPASGVAVAVHFSEQAVAIDCQGQPQVRPGNFTLACADGNDYLTRLSWTSWTAGLASAIGVQEVNDCDPYCAAGHFHGYPVDVTFRGSASVPGQPGRQRYTKVTLRYPGARPDFYHHRSPDLSTLPLLAPSS
ncbi:MAG TPA: hypothetical protein VHO07_09530 [Streptosporangiaceae bacterium]|nr:hypothetical protein [Streptosporangiaceae bacterium]